MVYAMSELYPTALPFSEFLTQWCKLCHPTIFRPKIATYQPTLVAICTLKVF